MGAARTERTHAGRHLRRRMLVLGLATAALSVAALAGGAVSASATTTLAMPPRLEDVPYAGASSYQAANIYPSPYAGSPVVVLVHGGGWRSNAFLGYLELEARALQSQGFTVYEINYRQDTKTSPAFPMEPNDVVTATRWAIDTASSHNGDPNKLVLVGGSAGGQLVAVAATQIDTESPGAVDGVVTLSAAGANFLTLQPLVEAEALARESFEISIERALAWRQSVGGSFPQAYAERWSPTLHPPTVAADCPQWLLFNSEAELIPLAQAEEMHQSLVEAGCSASLTVVPGDNHAFAYFHIVKPQVFAFIRAVT